MKKNNNFKTGTNNNRMQNKNHHFTVLKSLCKYGAVVVVLWKFVDFENRQRRKIFVKITELIKLQ